MPRVTPELLDYLRESFGERITSTPPRFSLAQVHKYQKLLHPYQVDLLISHAIVWGEVLDKLKTKEKTLIRLRQCLTAWLTGQAYKRCELKVCPFCQAVRVTKIKQMISTPTGFRTVRTNLSQPFPRGKYRCDPSLTVHGYSVKNERFICRWSVLVVPGLPVPVQPVETAIAKVLAMPVKAFLGEHGSNLFNRILTNRSWQVCNGETSAVVADFDEENAES